MDFPFFFLFVICGITLINWVAAALDKRELYYASKPLVLIALILFFTQVGGTDAIRLPFLIALVFSLLGDIFLIHRSPNAFLAGMISFLAAHLVFIWAFIRFPVTREAVLPVVSGGIIFLVALLAFILTRMKNKPEFKRMRYAFIIYGCALTTMAITAVLCLWRPGWPKWAAILAALGGFLFFVSDALIGVEKMGKRLPAMGLIIISTYHIAQMLIMFSTLGL